MKIVNSSQTLHLTNITIRQLADKNGNPYFLIRDDDTNQAYFAFEGALPIQQWQTLQAKWETVKELEVEYETNDRGNNRVIYLSFDGDIFI